ncbi:response regulator [Parabacteroides acidifaciens]|uniref:histidine kinase n=1 Tax=Parabacteroides acidifaciens TaxID=2290935 RepID=A0A3D8HAA1_9BACT|nr:response regulator [Parabacteroides acidifaciens]MBC8603504.1 response regulator [Parabacteroides acidifaciens]RDU47781.1 response regulator [Parabacteroides acidifaciens]
MNKKSLFRRMSGVLLCTLLSTSAILATNESGQFFGSDTLVVVVILLLFLLPLFFYMRKLQSNMNGRSDQIIKENFALENSNKELTAKNGDLLSRNGALEEQVCRQEEKIQALRTQNDELAKANGELVRKTSELESTVSTLNNNKKEMEQLIVTKIKENDAIQREAVEKLAEAENRLKNAESIHDNFFIETIHEMRTPLSLVLGSLALVVQNDDPGKDMSTQLLSAYRNTLAMQDLADQLIGTRRSNDVANYLRIARYDMVDISRQICDIFVDWVAMNNVDFRINTQTPALWVWVDRRKIEFALRMLLSNAFKNTFAYGKVTLDISVVKENGKAYCSLVVKDEGLDEDESARRGLKQIMDMADAIGGFYRHEADKNGTSYAVLVPLGKQHLLDRRVEFVEPEADLVKLNARQKEDIAELIQVIPQKQETGKKLLVIDDSDQIRWFLKHVFSKEYQILEARNGQDGVDVALAEEPDLILCDVMMPVKDGYETCREIKSDPKMAQTPVVMLTAKVESEDVITGIEAGADDYITKPFDVEILRSKINSLMKKRDDMKRYFSHTTSASEEENALPTNPFMDAVVKNIEKHLDDSTFEAKILADSLNMSLPTLYRKIKQYSDLSILELTRNIRLKKAAELLATQQYSVQEVAEMVGFNDTATFRKRFTEQYGVTPSQYGVPA